MSSKSSSKSSKSIDISLTEGILTIGMIGGFFSLLYSIIGFTILHSVLLIMGIHILLSIFYEENPLHLTLTLLRTFQKQEQKQGITVDGCIDDYNKLHDDNTTDQTTRNEMTLKLVNAYYDLATLFYEWGWGQSFHFAHRLSHESFHDSILRHEYYLASRLGNHLRKGDKLLDCGCGIGGPMRNIARFTKCDITGITINQYQVDRGNELNRKAGFSSDEVCSVQGDFMNLPFQNNTFDGVYAIEATCHAPDRTKVFSEIYRVLKPGSYFACYEWCLTDKYDKENEEHVRIKKQIEEGDGLPDTAYTWEMDNALKQVGFELIETCDLADEIDVIDDTASKNMNGDKRWYHPLTPSWNPFTQRFQFNKLGMWLTTNILILLEKCYLAPPGTSKVQTMLQQGAIGLAAGGITKTFTPMYLCVARKPLVTEHQ